VQELGIISEERMGGGRRLTDLRVLELRQELEKRGLDKSGIKAVLVERLTMVRFCVINCKVLMYRLLSWCFNGGIVLSL